MSGRQRIPRPPGARSGGPPPWAAAGAARTRLTLDRVRPALRMAAPRPAAPALPPELASSLPVAAVLVPLFESDGEVRVILTRRSSSLRSHTGEVSFPGGRVEAGELPVAAALREAHEEVGIDPSAVEILGPLAPLSTLSTGAAVLPFVGALAGRPAIRPSPHEVELAFDVALADLAADGAYREERWAVSGLGERSVHFFDLPEDTVWGATARILHELLSLVVAAPPAMRSGG